MSVDSVSSPGSVADDASAAHAGPSGNGAVPDEAVAPLDVTHRAPPHAHANLRGRLLATDYLALTLAWAAALAFLPVPLGSLPELGLAALLVVGMPAVTIALLGAWKLYRARECAVRALENARLLKAAAASTVLGIVVAELTGLPWTPWPFLVGGLAAFHTLVIGRATFNLWIAKRRRRGDAQWPVVLVGINEESAELHRLFADHPEYGFDVRGVVGPREDAGVYHPDAPWLGDVDAVTQALRRSDATGAVVASTALHPDDFNATVRTLLHAGAHIRVSNGLRGIAHKRLRTAPVGHEPLFYIEQWSLSPWQLRAKRALDLLAIGAGMVVAGPLLLAIAAVIKAADPSAPVLFRQERLGLHGQPFQLLKFRTMVVDAEARLAELQEANARTGPLFKMERDPRVTPIGRFLRASSLDELPQLLNVLKGEMSLVGPRPALEEETEQFSDRLRERMSVLPGITGLWQVEARDNPSFRSYERLDLFYVENWSVGLDLSILLATVLVVIDRTLGALRGLLPRRGGETAAASATLE